MTYDEAKLVVFATLWLPEVGQQFWYTTNHSRVIIVVYEVFEDEIKVYRKRYPDCPERHIFSFAEWWRCVTMGLVTVPK
jgi:hypothetical protein